MKAHTDTALPTNTQGPFSCWYRIPSGAAVASAHELLHQVIEEEGPFDGVLGFSQGAAVILSMIMHQELTYPNSPPLFNFAIFIACPIAFSPDPQFMQSQFMSHATSLDDFESGRLDQKEVSGPKYRASLLLAHKRKELAQEVRSIMRQVQELGAADQGEEEEYPELSVKSKQTKEVIEALPRMYHPLMITQRVSIPIVHIIGVNDPWKKLSEVSMRLGSSLLVKEVLHQGGHHFPLMSANIRACVEAVNWAIEKGKHRRQFY